MVDSSAYLSAVWPKQGLFIFSEFLQYVRNSSLLFSPRKDSMNKYLITGALMLTSIASTIYPAAAYGGGHGGEGGSGIPERFSHLLQEISELEVGAIDDIIYFEPALSSPTFWKSGETPFLIDKGIPYKIKPVEMAPCKGMTCYNTNHPAGDVPRNGVVCSLRELLARIALEAEADMKYKLKYANLGSAGARVAVRQKWPYLAKASAIVREEEDKGSPRDTTLFFVFGDYQTLIRIP